MSDDNTDLSSKNNCREFVDLLEKKEIGLSLSAPQQASFDKHMQACRACSIIMNQHEQINELASMMPQFDVSEGLTQKILESVSVESAPKVETPLLPLALAATFIFFLLVPFDSIQSLFGWGVGILGLIALQVLMQTAGQQEQVVMK